VTRNEQKTMASSSAIKERLKKIAEDLEPFREELSGMRTEILAMQEAANLVTGEIEAGKHKTTAALEGGDEASLRAAMKATREARKRADEVALASATRRTEIQVRVSELENWRQGLKPELLALQKVAVAAIVEARQVADEVSRVTREIQEAIEPINEALNLLRRTGI